jgi:hypothetical protein
MYTVAVGKKKDEDCITGLEEQEQLIMNDLKAILLQKGNLHEFFGKHNDASANKKQKKTTRRKNNSDSDSSMDGDRFGTNANDLNKSKMDQMQNSDPFDVDVSVQEFVDAIFNAKICLQQNRIQLLAETIRDNGKADQSAKAKQGASLKLGVIEDYALGFR